jgi:sugar lactone lactonase YvrE
VDREGNVWVTDSQGPDGEDPDREGKGHAAYKFSPTGRLLLTLGTPGVAGDGTGPALNSPSDLVTSPNGDIFVADGAGGRAAEAPPTAIARIVKYAKDGTFITAWGTVGSGPGQLRAPQGLALDARGRLFVADRGNGRIQIFDQEGQFLDAWPQFGRATGIYIDRDGLLYSADPGSRNSAEGWGGGIRIGTIRDGTVMHFIPDSGAQRGMSGVVGVAADGQGNVFGARVNPEIPPRALMKYVRRAGR